MKDREGLEQVGAVAIGRNESERLRACLGSLLRDLSRVVYVDSGSSDNSLEIAAELAVETVELDTSSGFTAARARNAGFKRLLEVSPSIEFVQFIDSDCQMDENWIRNSAKFVGEKADVAVVGGRRREREPKRNWYHRLADMEWNSLPGPANSCGGDALIRVSAFLEVGGYRESLIAGEEPELCTRLRQAGWKIWRLDHDMTLHDIRMNEFRQWWKRAVRSGHAYTEVAMLHGSIRERHRLRRICSIWLWGTLPLIAVGLAWSTHGLSLLLGGILYLLLVIRIISRRIRTHRDSFSNTVLYSAACVVANVPQLIGSLIYFKNRLFGSRSLLMEYSGTPKSERRDHSSLERVTSSE